MISLRTDHRRIQTSPTPCTTQHVISCETRLALLRREPLPRQLKPSIRRRMLPYRDQSPYYLQTLSMRLGIRILRPLETPRSSNEYSKLLLQQHSQLLARQRRGAYVVDTNSN